MTVGLAVSRRRPVVVPGFAVAAPDPPQDAAVVLDLLGWECGRVEMEEVRRGPTYQGLRGHGGSIHLPRTTPRDMCLPPFRWPSGDGTMSQQRARQGRTGTTLNDDGQQLVHITRSPHGGAIIMRNDKGRALVELELALSALPSASFVRWQRCGRPIRSSHAQFLAYFLAILLQQEVANGYQL